MYLKKMPGTDGNRYNMREVSPYGLSLVQENWVLIARCDMRQDIRHFRLSRMTELSVLEDQFLLPSGFDLNSHRPPDDRNEQILIRAKPEIADKIMEAIHFYMDRKGLFALWIIKSATVDITFTKMLVLFR